MDIAITEKKKINVKLYAMVAVAVVVSLFVIQYIWTLGQADFSVERSSLVISDVRQGQFTVSVRGAGVLVPEHIQWLSAEVEANVEQRIVKAGVEVKKGDLIVVLANPQLVQQLTEAKWDLETKEEEKKAAQVAEELAILSQKSEVLNAKLNFERSQVEFDMQTELLGMAEGNVSQLDYRRTKLETQQYKARWEIAQERLGKMQENLLAQNNARVAQLNKTRNIVKRIEEQVDGLRVKASMDSIVLEMPLEPGQRILMGTKIAKLARKDSLIGELQVPEIQINDVQAGQKVLIDTRNSKFEGTVQRVDPTVINGNVQVDVIFVGQLPTDARPDLSVDGEIKIAEVPNALFVDRPLFAQSRANTAVYKVSDDGQFAERINVQTGFGSVNQIQIIKGLMAGDRIITSDPTRFESYNKFRIK